MEDEINLRVNVLGDEEIDEIVNRLNKLRQSVQEVTNAALKLPEPPKTAKADFDTYIGNIKLLEDTLNKVDIADIKFPVLDSKPYLQNIKEIADRHEWLNREIRVPKTDWGVSYLDQLKELTKQTSADLPLEVVDTDSVGAIESVVDSLERVEEAAVEATAPVKSLNDKIEEYHTKLAHDLEYIRNDPDLGDDIANQIVAEPNLEYIKPPRLEFGYADVTKDIKSASSAWKELLTNLVANEKDILENSLATGQAIAYTNQKIAERIAIMRNRDEGDEEGAMADRKELARLDAKLKGYQAIQGMYISQTKIIKNQTSEQAKMEARDKSRVGVIESIMRRYRWMQSLILVTLNFLRVLGGQSKVLGSIMSILGSGLGMILNAFLIPMLPLVITVFYGLLWIAEQIDALNQIKIPIPFTGWEAPLGSTLIGLLLIVAGLGGLSIFAAHVITSLKLLSAWFAATKASAWLLSGGLALTKGTLLATGWSALFAFGALTTLGVIVGGLAGLLLGGIVVWGLWKLGILDAVSDAGRWFGIAFHNMWTVSKNLLSNLMSLSQDFTTVGLEWGLNILDGIVQAIGGGSLENIPIIGDFVKGIRSDIAARKESRGDSFANLSRWDDGALVGYILKDADKDKRATNPVIDAIARLDNAFFNGLFAEYPGSVGAVPSLESEALQQEKLLEQAMMQYTSGDTVFNITVEGDMTDETYKKFLREFPALWTEQNKKQNKSGQVSGGAW